MNRKLLIEAIAKVSLGIIRIAQEDQVLQKGLDGYIEYKERICWRLIPWIW
ncbi:MAG: hypothetical protein IJ315_02400 [Firmicutes bacterium]|nr:hypothetical protein [Bacillota bacterium]